MLTPSFEHEDFGSRETRAFQSKEASCYPGDKQQTERFQSHPTSVLKHAHCQCLVSEGSPWKYGLPSFPGPAFWKKGQAWDQGTGSSAATLGQSDLGNIVWSLFPQRGHCLGQ